jgi:uncharacterized coiled-coil protein SlyX
MAIMQNELAQMSHEVYAQQKEIAQLMLEIEKLKSRLENVQPDSGILSPNEDVPPPHY